MPRPKKPLERRRGMTLLVALASLTLCSTLTSAGELSPAAVPARIELRLPDLNGLNRDLEDFRGKVVLVNFWASWCTPCITEMPSLQRLADATREKPFVVIGVNVGEGELRVKTAVQRLGMAFPVLLDKDSSVFHRWGGSVLPTTYVLDGDGVVRYVGLGPLEWDGIAVREVLDELAAHAISR